MNTIYNKVKGNKLLKSIDVTTDIEVLLSKLWKLMVQVQRYYSILKFMNFSKQITPLFQNYLKNH